LRLIAEAGPSVLYPPRAAWHFLAQTNSQAIALTNAMPQIERLWELPKVGGYLDRFAKRTQEIGHILKDS